MQKITRRQRQALEAAIDIERQYNDGVRYSDLAEALGIKIGSAQPLVKALLEAGYLAQTEPGKAGGIRVKAWPDGTPFDPDLEHQRWVAERTPLNVLLETMAHRQAQPSSGEPGALTPAQRTLLGSLQRAYQRLMRPVLVGELARERNQSIHIVERHLPTLESGGFIERRNSGLVPLLDYRGRPVRQPVPIPQTPRLDDRPIEPARNPAVQLLEVAIDMLRDSELVAVPVLGTIAAGQPISFVESDPTALPLPKAWVGTSPCYVLRVAGESMTGDGILDGDYVLVRYQESVEPGLRHIYVCWTGEGATLKRVSTDSDAAWLVASNTDYRPIRAPEGTRGQGRVVKVIRDLD